MTRKYDVINMHFQLTSCSPKFNLLNDPEMYFLISNYKSMNIYYIYQKLM